MRGGRRCRLLRLRVFDQGLCHLGKGLCHLGHGLCHLGQGQRYLDRGHNHRYLVYGYQGRQEVMFIIGIDILAIFMVYGSWFMGIITC